MRVLLIRMLARIVLRDRIHILTEASSTSPMDAGKNHIRIFTCAWRVYTCTNGSSFRRAEKRTP